MKAYHSGPRSVVNDVDTEYDLFTIQHLNSVQRGHGLIPYLNSVLKKLGRMQVQYTLATV